MCCLKGFGVWCRFGLKMGIDFAHFGLELGVVCEGTVEVFEHIYCSNSKWIREKY